MYEMSSTRERGLLWLLAFTQFTVIMDFMVMMPLGPQIIDAFTITPAVFATAVSAYAFCSGLSSFFAATYIDRFDRRTLMLTVYALFALSNLGCAVAPNFHMLVLARCFAGLTGGVLGAVVMAIVSDVIPPQRRGQATGVIMTAFGLASVAGVPAGVALGAHFGWASPFYLLVLLSLIIWGGGAFLLPSLRAHLSAVRKPVTQVLPDLFSMVAQPIHMRAFTLTFLMMTSQMLIIPFISVILVANYGIAKDEIAWLYIAGGATSFFSSPIVGKLSDKYGKHIVFRITCLISVLPILFLTHMPALPLLGVVAFFAVFMVAVSSRMVPMQALLTTVPEPAKRGPFLSVNGAIQSIGTGLGAWLGGLLLTTQADGRVTGYGTNGWCTVALIALAFVWVGQVHATEKKDVAMKPA